MMECNLIFSAEKPSWKKSRISYRKIKSINLAALKEDLSNSILNKNMLLMDLNELANSYDNTLSSALENHAPLISKPSSRDLLFRGLMHDDVKSAKRARRQAERKWRRTGLPSDFTDFQQYKEQKNQATFAMNKARKKYYRNFIHENGNDQGKLFKSAKTLLDYRDPTARANDIGHYFIQKIKIMHSL